MSSSPELCQGSRIFFSNLCCSKMRLWGPFYSTLVLPTDGVFNLGCPNHHYDISTMLDLILQAELMYKYSLRQCLQHMLSPTMQY